MEGEYEKTDRNAQAKKLSLISILICHLANRKKTCKLQWEIEDKNALVEYAKQRICLIGDFGFYYPASLSTGADGIFYSVHKSEAVIQDKIGWNGTGVEKYIIKIQFSNLDNRKLDDISKELGMNVNIVEFFRFVLGLEFEETDNEADLDDNIIYYFSSQNEIKDCETLELIMNRHLQNVSSIVCTTEIVRGLVDCLSAARMTEVKRIKFKPWRRCR